MIFSLVATIFLALALLLVLLPIQKHKTKNARWTIALTVLVFIAGAVTLYATLGYWRAVVPLSMTETQSASAENMVEQLAARLVREPDDMQGWTLLGRSYLVLGNYSKAERALAHALQLNSEAGNSPNADLLSSYAEVLVLLNQGQVTPQARTIFERVLELAPNNPRALLFTGLAAFSQQDYQLAEQRLAKVMALQPPESLRKIIAPRLEKVRSILGKSVAASENSNQTTNTQTAHALTVTIRLDNELRGSVSGQGNLFIYARLPQGGPPLAVERHKVSALPLTVTLDRSDAMLPSRQIDLSKTMIIGARISRSGQALPQSGDLQGEVIFTPGNATDIQLVIDSVIP